MRDSHSSRQLQATMLPLQSRGHLGMDGYTAGHLNANAATNRPSERSSGWRELACLEDAQSLFAGQRWSSSYC